MARELGGPAPGPRTHPPPDPHRIAELAYTAFHPWGIERGRAETLIRVASKGQPHGGGCGDALRRCVRPDHRHAAWERGPQEQWASSLSVIPMRSPWVTTTSPTPSPTHSSAKNADDNRMLELLEEFRPHRGRVVQLVRAAHVAAPKYGPRKRSGPSRSPKRSALETACSMQLAAPTELIAALHAAGCKLKISPDDASLSDTLPPWAKNGPRSVLAFSFGGISRWT